MKQFASHIETVRLFGSRATNTYKNSSDIDLCVTWRDDSNKVNFLDQLDQLPLPYKFDVLDSTEIYNDKLMENIRLTAVTIFQTNDKGEFVMTSNKIDDKKTSYIKALSKLHETLARDASQDDIVIDATIQRFEFSFELSWKLLKAMLEFEGISNATSPRSAIKEAFQVGIIQDGEGWLRMLEDRNRTSHTYDEETALEIYNLVKDKHIHQLDQLKDYLSQPQ